MGLSGICWGGLVVGLGSLEGGAVVCVLRGEDGLCSNRGR